MRPRFRFHSAGITHTGHKRTTNEDQFLVCEIRRRLCLVQTSLPAKFDCEREIQPPGHLLLLADGVGGAAKGQEASQVAVDAFLDYITEALSFGDTGSSWEDDLVREFRSGIALSHARVIDKGREDPARHGMATTFTLAFVLGRRALIAHVGDSRCYVIRGDKAERITKDQTFAQILVDRGVMEAKEAEGSRWSHVLSSAVGGAKEEEPDVLSYREVLAPGDYLVLCTDGLGKHVSETEMEVIVAGSSSVDEAAESLVTAALEGGGSDNITVIVGQIREISDSDD